jgi:hypothetical protein
MEKKHGSEDRTGKYHIPEVKMTMITTNLLM